MAAILALCIPLLALLPLFWCMLSLYSGSPCRLVYFTHMRSKRSAEVEKVLNLIVGKYRAGMLSVKADEHTMTFSDGTCIWIGNKYYASGHIWDKYNDRYPYFGTWRELMRIHAETIGYDDRTIYERITGKYKVKKKDVMDEIVNLDDFFLK